MNDRPSTLGAHVSGRRAGQRFDAEHGVTTEALLFLGDLDPEAIGPNIVHATHYEPTPIGDLDVLLAEVSFPLESATFVDVGSGMGRVVLLAAQYPFRQIVGVEISPALCEVARENLARSSTAGRRCRDVRLVCGDAARFRFPRGPFVAYLYNPFDAVVLATVLDRIAATPRRDVALLYHTPVHRAVFAAHPAFELVSDVAPGAVYHVKERSSTPIGVLPGPDSGGPFRDVT